MTKLGKMKIACTHCEFGSTSHWLFDHGLVQCQNEKSDHFNHILNRWHGCRQGRETRGKPADISQEIEGED